MKPEEATGSGNVYVWLGKSGMLYRYSVHPFGSPFGQGSVNFILTREIAPGRFAPVYVGQTDDLSAPNTDHPAMACVRLSRVTHIHVHFSKASEAARRVECSDLIAQWNPPCNRMR